MATDPRIEAVITALVGGRTWRGLAEELAADYATIAVEALDAYDRAHPDRVPWLEQVCYSPTGVPVYWGDDKIYRIYRVVGDDDPITELGDEPPPPPADPITELSDGTPPEVP